jgi:L-threonylcarbamoyladenylate synthase
MKTELIPADHPVALNHTVDVLRNGGLVAFPTDTVYGLASLPFKTEYVERLFAAKGRNSSRAIAVLIGCLDDLPKITPGLGEVGWQLAKRFWPGPLTLVVPKNPRLPEVLSQNASVGVRMPDHKIALSLLCAAGPLAVTSANRSGMENTNTAQEVKAQLDGRIHLILDGGRVPGGVPSTVVDCTGSELVVLREGPITLESMQRVLAGQD